MLNNIYRNIIIIIQDLCYMDWPGGYIGERPSLSRVLSMVGIFNNTFLVRIRGISSSWMKTLRQPLSGIELPFSVEFRVMPTILPVRPEAATIIKYLSQ